MNGDPVYLHRGNRSREKIQAEETYASNEEVHMRDGWHYRRGDIYLADLNPRKGSEQGGVRPVVVISNNTGNHYSDVLTVIPVTTALKKEEQPTHYILLNRGRLDKPSMVIAEQHRVIAKERALRYLGTVSQEDMPGVEAAVRVALGL